MGTELKPAPSSPMPSGSQDHIVWPSIPTHLTTTGASPAIGEKSKKPLDPADEDRATIVKPEKFRSRKHEKEWECRDHRRRIIIKVERADFIPKFPDYNESMTDKFLIKNPANYGRRLNAMKAKIYNATGIHPHRLDILKMTFSITKKAKLCWLTFASERTVSDIFRLTQVNNNMKSFNAFPHIPAKALERKNKVEEILKGVQGIDRKLRYQVRLGKSDVVIMVKHHVEYDYRQYVPVSLDVIDPNCEVPEWDLNTKAEDKDEVDDNFKGAKRGAECSPEGSNARKKKTYTHIDDWQIAEFLEAFINGTATEPNYGDADWLETEVTSNYNSDQNTTYNVESNNHIDLDTDII